MKTRKALLAGPVLAGLSLCLGCNPTHEYNTPNEIPPSNNQAAPKPAAPAKTSRLAKKAPKPKNDNSAAKSSGGFSTKSLAD